MVIFGDFDLKDFWDDSDYARREYTEDAPTDEEIAAIETTLGYRLPRAYIELARAHNGGTPKKNRHRTPKSTSWASDHVAITGILAIGRTKPSSLLGSAGQELWLEEWEYPAIGVYFADTPSGGHDMLCLDYRTCGKEGEPLVVHVDQEDEADDDLTVVASDFESFIRGLESDEAFDLGA